VNIQRRLLRARERRRIKKARAIQLQAWPNRPSNGYAPGRLCLPARRYFIALGSSHNGRLQQRLSNIRPTIGYLILYSFSCMFYAKRGKENFSVNTPMGLFWLLMVKKGLPGYSRHSHSLYTPNRKGSPGGSSACHTANTGASAALLCVVCEGGRSSGCRHCTLVQLLYVQRRRAWLCLAQRHLATVRCIRSSASFTLRSRQCHASWPGATRRTKLALPLSDVSLLHTHPRRC
jgi:hypothetical protein